LVFRACPPKPWRRRVPHPCPPRRTRVGLSILVLALRAPNKIDNRRVVTNQPRSLPAGRQATGLIDLVVGLPKSNGLLDFARVNRE
jgi:hypothetical protein